jgi:hypothetical protein
MEEHRSKVLGISTVRRIYSHRREDVTGDEESF